MTSGKKALFFIGLLLLTVPLSGCLTAGLGPQFSQAVTPDSGKAIIYVYRARVAMTGHEVPGVKMNDSEIVKALPELTYFPISVTPGDYQFTPKLFGIYKTTPASLSVEAGQTYFVQMRLTVGHIQFQQVGGDEAMAYMSTCYLLNPDYAKDSRVLAEVNPAASGSASAQETSSPAPAEIKAEKSADPVAAGPPVNAKAESPKQKPKAPVVSEAKLFVDATPADARIRIMNIRPKFHQGILLDAGRYKIDVSAPGYQSFVKWISLDQGEARTLAVALVANEPATAPRPEPTKQAEPVKAKKQPTVKTPDNLSAEEKHYAELLESNSAVDIRNAAKNIYYRHSGSEYLAAAAEQCLLKNYNDNVRDNMHIDAMAWLCKALANTHNGRFRETLKTVSENAENRKLQRYADKSLRAL